MAPTTAYGLGACLGDLLSAAARVLRLGGRLVYFLPTAAGPVPRDRIPSHPALALVADCEQPLSRWYSRRLVVMEKTAPPDPAAEAAHAAAGANAAAFDAATAVAAGVYGAYAEGGGGCVRKGRSKQT
jgi:tRNA (guanine10-N2)-methyltransferase